MIIDSGSLPNENLLVESLVNKAAELYDSYGECGERCNHPSGCCNGNFYSKSSSQSCDNNDAVADAPNNCLERCLACSEEVHFHESKRGTNRRDEYNCQKLTYYYTCRYSWKYCSEIIYALESIDLSIFDSFNILSLGCGAAPDLMAFEQKNREYNYPIKYLGVDKNQYWEELHSAISDYCLNTDMRAQFIAGDIFEVLKGNFRISLHEPYNVVIMQYLISSFPNDERSQMVDTLFDLLIENVISRKDNTKPFFAILNDIDHFEARDFFDTLYKKIEQAGYHCNVVKGHFKPRKYNYGDGSNLYTSYTNKFAIPNSMMCKFNCAIQCSSAQMILEVR